MYKKERVERKARMIEIEREKKCRALNMLMRC